MVTTQTVLASSCKVEMKETSLLSLHFLTTTPLHSAVVASSFFQLLVFSEEGMYF
jgi:hypothetical protein